jgi:hypothetical protein
VCTGVPPPHIYASQSAQTGFPNVQPLGAASCPPKQTQPDEEWGEYQKSPAARTYQDKLDPEERRQMYADRFQSRGDKDRKAKRDRRSDHRRHRDSSSESEIDWYEYVMDPRIDIGYQVADRAYYQQFEAPWNVEPPPSTKAQDKRDAKLMEDSKLIAGMKFKGTVDSYFIWRKMFIMYVHTKTSRCARKGSRCWQPSTPRSASTALFVSCS